MGSMRFLSLAFLLLNVVCFGAESSVVIREALRDRIAYEEGEVLQRITPCSTFKIALSLMGFDSGILQDLEMPVWRYDEEYKSWNTQFCESWTQPHSPKLWIKNSCIWYSQLLTFQLGFRTFSHYVQLFDYGNQDLQGDPGEENGLTHAWLSSSLKISPREQTLFLNKLFREHLPVDPYAFEMTKALLFVENLHHGWSLYGKTGSGFESIYGGVKLPVSWFVGWVKKGEWAFSFAYLLKAEFPEETITPEMAVEQLKEKIQCVVGVKS